MRTGVPPDRHDSPPDPPDGRRAREQSRGPDRDDSDDRGRSNERDDDAAWERLTKSEAAHDEPQGATAGSADSSRVDAAARSAAESASARTSRAMPTAAESLERGGQRTRGRRGSQERQGDPEGQSAQQWERPVRLPLPEWTPAELESSVSPARTWTVLLGVTVGLSIWVFGLLYLVGVWVE